MWSFPKTENPISLAVTKILSFRKKAYHLIKSSVIEFYKQNCKW